MAVFRAEKVVSQLPDPLEPDTIYYVRTGEGFDIFVSDITGSVAHKQNSPDITPGDVWTLSADAVTFSYDTEGRISGLAENVGADLRTTTYTYVDGLLSESVVEFRGLVRTETFTYDVDGVLTDSSAVVTEAA